MAGWAAASHPRRRRRPPLHPHTPGRHSLAPNSAQIARTLYVLHHTVPARRERDTVLMKSMSFEMMPAARPYSQSLARAMTWGEGGVAV